MQAVSAFQELADRLSGKTPKQQFDAVVGAQRLWWQYCQDAVRAQPDWSAAHERLRHLSDEQASSEDASRSFMAAIHATSAVAQVMAADIADADGSDGRHPLAAVSGQDLRLILRPAMRHWADAGLLVPASSGAGPALDRILSGVDPSLRRRLRVIMRVLDDRQGGGAWAMVVLTALRLAGVRPRRGNITRVPVLFDRAGTAGGTSGVLEIREFPAGPAGLYPDPEAMSFTRADEEFTCALASAWSYANRSRTVDHCVMWRLTLEGEVPVPSIGGGSLAAAFAIALREHTEKRVSRRRPWTPIRAAFLGLRPRCAITGAIASGDALAAVGGMEAKIEAARARNWRLVAPKSNEAAVVHVPDGVHVYWAATLRQASRYARRWRPVRTSVAVLVTCIAVVVSMTVRADRELVDAHAATARTNREFVSAHAAAVANQLIADSKETSSSDPVLARQEAVAAWRIDPSDQARYAMRNAAALPQVGILNGAASTATTVAFSPDGKMLAAVGDPGTGGSGAVQLWDVGDRQQLGDPVTGPNAANGVGPVAFSPDGRILAIGMGETVELWDKATHHHIGDLNTGRTEFTSVSEVQFSPDGTILAIGRNDGTVQFWNVAHRRRMGTSISLAGGIESDGTVSSVMAMAFRPDGKTLATVTASDSAAGAVELWNVATHQQIGRPFVLTGIANPRQQSVALSPDGTTVAIGGYGVELWNVVTRRHTTNLESSADPGKVVNAVAFSHDGKTLAIGNGQGTTEIWNLATRQAVGPLLTSTSAVESIAFSSDGQTLATGNDDGTVHLWDTALESPFTSSRNIGSIAFNPVSGNLAANVPHHPRQLQLWNIITGQRTGTVPSNGADGVGSAAFSPHGKTLAVGRNDGTVQLWDVATRRQIGRRLPYSGDTQGASETVSLAFSPDGRTLATASFDYGAAQLWNVATQRLIGTFSTDSDTIDTVAISPDGKLLATGADEGTTRLWNVATHQQVGAPMNSADPIDSIAFSPDGKTLAAGYDNGEVRLWNLADHQQIGTPLVLTGNVNSIDVLTFSPDSTTLAVGRDDGTVQLWDVPTRQPIGNPLASPTDNEAVGTLAFSPDGETLIDSTNSGTKLWHLAYLVNAVPYLCKWAGRPLTAAQWAQYAPGVAYQNICS